MNTGLFSQDFQHLEYDPPRILKNPPPATPIARPSRRMPRPRSRSTAYLRRLGRYQPNRDAGVSGDLSENSDYEDAGGVAVLEAVRIMFPLVPPPKKLRAPTRPHAATARRSVCAAGCGETSRWATVPLQVCVSSDVGLLRESVQVKPHLTLRRAGGAWRRLHPTFGS